MNDSGCRVLEQPQTQRANKVTEGHASNSHPKRAPEAGRRTLIPEPLLKPWMLSVRREDWRPVAVGILEQWGAPREGWFGELMCEWLSHNMAQFNGRSGREVARPPSRTQVGCAVKGFSHFATQPAPLFITIPSWKAGETLACCQEHRLSEAAPRMLDITPGGS